MTSVGLRMDRQGDRACLTPIGPFDLGHAITAAEALDNAEAELSGCSEADLDLAQLERIDGAGAVLLARFCDRLDADGCKPHLVEGPNSEAAHLITRYRQSRGEFASPRLRRLGPLARIGALAAGIPGIATDALNFTGRCAAALPKAAAKRRSVDWRSVPGLLQDIGADALLVTGAANLLVGIIIAFLGVSQLAPLGATAYVPGLVVVAHFRELGPLVTAIVVAGRSGAGLASEIATMKVSEEIDALNSLGFDVVAWLVVPRCLALMIALPILTWIGDLLALGGGLMATTSVTNMTPRAYAIATADHITVAHLFVGLSKTPFLALAIGLIACGQGLANTRWRRCCWEPDNGRGGAVHLLCDCDSALFTFFFALIGI